MFPGTKRQTEKKDMSVSSLKTLCVFLYIGSGSHERAARSSSPHGGRSQFISSCNDGIDASAVCTVDHKDKLTLATPIIIKYKVNSITHISRYIKNKPILIQK